MTIDEIAERSTIRFLTPLSLGEAEELLMYVARTMPANIHYNVHYFRSINHGFDGEDPMIYDGTVGISANLSGIRAPMAFDAFEFGSSIEDSSRLDSIRFQRVQDWELSDYRPEIRQLWDNTRRIIQAYFTTREDIGNESDDDEVEG